MKVCSSSSRCITQTMSCRFRPCLKLKWREICYTNMESRIHWTSWLGLTAGASDVNRDVIISHLRLGLVGRVEQRLQLAVHRLLVLLTEFLLELRHRASGQIWEHRHETSASILNFSSSGNKQTDRHAFYKVCWRRREIRRSFNFPPEQRRLCWCQNSKLTLTHFNLFS